MIDGKKYLSDILDIDRITTKTGIRYAWVISRMDQTVEDFSKEWEKLKPFICEKTLTDVIQFIRLGRKFLYQSFCLKIDDIFNSSEDMCRLPFVIRYKLAMETPMDIFLSKDEIGLLQAIALFDEASRSGQRGLLVDNAYRNLMGDVAKVISNCSARMLLQGHFEAQTELSRLMPSQMSHVPIYRYESRIGQIGKNAFRPRPSCSLYHSHGLMEYDSSRNIFESRPVYTVEQTNGSSELFEIDDRSRFGIDFPSETVPHTFAFLENYIITWRMNKSDYKAGFNIRPIGSDRRPVEFSIGPLTPSSHSFYSINPVKDNTFAVSYVVQNSNYEMKTVFVKIELVNGTVNLDHIDTVRGWFLESSQNYVLLAERCMMDDYLKKVKLDTLKLNLDHPLPEPKKLPILPVTMENIIVYRYHNGIMELKNTIAKATTRILSNVNTTFFDFLKTMNCNVAGNNVRINEIDDSIIEIAVIDRAAGCKRRLTTRLQVYKVNVTDPDNGAKKAIMLTEPPLCPFSSDWRYVDGELVFLRTKRMHIRKREGILTTLSFLCVDYKTGLVCCSRQEEARGLFNRFPDYDTKDFAQSDYEKKPWTQFLTRFRSAFCLKRC